MLTERKMWAEKCDQDRYFYPCPLIVSVRPKIDM